MDKGYWNWLLKYIKSFCRARWIKNPWVEYFAGISVFVLGIMVSLYHSIYWPIPVFAVGSLLVSIHGLWRIEKRG